MSFCEFIINSNNELYFVNDFYGKQYCGINQLYNEYTKVAENVEKVFTDSTSSGYINSNNELYVSTSGAKFEKILENVNSVTTHGMTTLFVLTNDNKLYIYDTNAFNNSENKLTLQLSMENISEIGLEYYKNTNNEYTMISSSDRINLNNEKSQLLYKTTEYSKVYYWTLNLPDVKDINKMLYFDENYTDKLIYLSNNGKIVLVNKDGKKELEYNIDSLEEVYEFLNPSK